MLPRKKRLTGKRAVQRVYQRGSRTGGQFLLLRSIENRTGMPRIAIVVSASVSKKATERNRAKRILRALLAKRALPPQDMVLSVKRLPQENWSRAFDQELSRWLPK